MEDVQLINLWNSYDDRFNDLYQLTQQNLREITRMKVSGNISSMKPVKLFAVVIGLCWVGLIGSFVTLLFINAYASVSLFFLYSAAVQVLITAIAIIIYLYQLALIYQVDIGEPVIKTQKRLGQLRSSTLWVTRILILQAPVWTTFYLSAGMFKSNNAFLLILQLLITVSVTVATLWLFLNIRMENRKKKWFTMIFRGGEWTPIIQSMEMLEEIRDYSDNDER